LPVLEAMRSERPDNELQDAPPSPTTAAAAAAAAAGAARGAGHAHAIDAIMAGACTVDLPTARTATHTGAGADGDDGGVAPGWADAPQYGSYTGGAHACDSGCRMESDARGSQQDPQTCRSRR
jgi:hypothetical protein